MRPLGCRNINHQTKILHPKFGKIGSQGICKLGIISA